MKKFLRLYYNLYLIIFLNGFFLASTIYFFIESQYEAELFTSIAHKILSDSSSRSNPDSFFKHSMDIANYLVGRRGIVFDNKIGGIKAEFFHSSTVDLMTGEGACGSATVVLARILKANNYQVRIAQMKVGDTWGGHIVTEVKKNSGWVVLDPLFDFYFKKPDGQYANFKEVSANWDYYKSQVPHNYPPKYNYEDVRYTNWNKYGFIGENIYKSLKMILGNEKANSICIRSYLLRNYNLLFWVSLLLWMICSWHIAWLIVRK